MKHFRVIILLILFAACSKVEDNNPLPFTDPDAPFPGVPATSDIAMYEINHRAFSSSGTLQGILPRLDSIRKLGINVIWLMPIYPVGQKNMLPPMGSPYSVKNYLEVNQELGTLDDLKTLVRETHKRGMAIILDWVANHTAWDNPWIENKSWYTQDGNGNIISPPGTNWLDVADLNYENDDMRAAMISAMKYWITTANVDGFRCDAADFVPYDFWKQAIDSLKKLKGRKLILLAEGARPDHFNAGFQMNFSWDFLSKMKSVWNGQPTSVLSYSNWYETASLPDSVRKLRFSTNHDETAWSDTPVALFGGIRGSMAAFVAAAFMGGVPLIYNGQEVGCTVKLPLFDRSPINWMTNPAMMAEYMKLMEVRNKSVAVKSGGIEYFSNSDVLTFKRTSTAEEMLVMINVRNDSHTIDLPAALAGTSWTDAMTGAAKTLGTSLSFEPYEYVILRKITTFAKQE